MRPGIGGIDEIVGALGHTILAHHRLGQALRITHVVETEAAFHAQPVLVRRAVLPGDVKELVVLDVVGELAADAAVWTDAVHLPIGEKRGGADIILVHQRRRHQRAGWAGLHAFAAGNARARAHRVVEVEHDLFVVPAPRHADHVVDLHLAARADAKIALDAGIEIDRHRRMAAVGRGLTLARGQAARRDPHAVGPGPELGCRIVRLGVAVRLVRDQQFEHHLARSPRAIGSRYHLHAGGRRANAACREYALALDLHHAGAAIAVGPVARLRRVAQMRDVGALALGDLPDRLAFARVHLDAVERERDGLRTCTFALHFVGGAGMCDVGTALDLGVTTS